MVNLKLGCRHSPYNHGENVWTFLHVLSLFLFITSEVELDYYLTKLYVQIVAQVSEQLKT